MAKGETRGDRSPIRTPQETRAAAPEVRVTGAPSDAALGMLVQRSTDGGKTWSTISRQTSQVAAETAAQATGPLTRVMVGGIEIAVYSR